MTSQLSPTAEPFVVGGSLPGAGEAEPSSSPFGELDGSPSGSAEWAQYSQDAASDALKAAYQADVASKCAADLASHIQYLWGTVLRLQGQVTELEDWKKKALEDVRKLRDEHKTLRRKVLGEDTHESGPSIQRAKTMPPQLVAGIVDGPPPGLGPPPKQDSSPLIQRSSSATSAVSSAFSSSLTSTSLMSSLSDVDGSQFEGVQLSTVNVDGTSFERAEWRIGQLSQKLRGCMGRALVSSPFSAAGLEELRLMVCPDGKETNKGPRSKRQKELYAKKVLEGPLDGCLKLKVPSCPPGLELQYYLKVGSSRKGPFIHNFSQSTVSGCDDFGIDWLAQLEPDSSLVVCVEIVKAPSR